MSKEKEPIRSRRQLREESAQAANTVGIPAVPPRPAPKKSASASPSDPGAPASASSGESAPPRGERQSQTRARDRAALRAYKELVDPPGLNPLPSRRALRQAQLDAERAPITAINPVVSATAAPSADAGSPVTKQSPQVEPFTQPEPESETESETAPETAPETALESEPEDVAQETAAEPEVVAPAPPVKAPKTVSPTAGRPQAGRRAAVSTASNQQRNRHPSSLDQLPAAKTKTPSGVPESAVPESPVPESPVPESPVPGDWPRTRANSASTPAVEQPDVQQREGNPAGTELPAAGEPDTAADAQSWKYPPLPGLVPGGNYYPVSAGPPEDGPAVVAPSTEELRIMAAERAEAERSAILSQRASARERLAQESAKNRKLAADPTATDNLAMVTPLEFIEVAGTDRPVLRPPTTTHVPIVTRSTPHQNVAKTPSKKAPVLRAEAQSGQSGAHARSEEVRSEATHLSAERFDAALAARPADHSQPDNRSVTGGHSNTLKRAQEMATGGQATVRPDAGQAQIMRSQMPPMPADYAHGLEPLDAITAGLGRTKRNLLIQWGSIIVGGAALVAGAVMFITALVR
ncbi:hypothetical protein AAFM46_09220 [Arthrobacter sp. TMP15]|uniref:hypothetical protein n=1 Tax=Arthrobacter sp. TMP15 TaxID=3140789 RepID=UPI0031BA3F1D